MKTWTPIAAFLTALLLAGCNAITPLDYTKRSAPAPSVTLSANTAAGTVSETATTSASPTRAAPSALADELWIIPVDQKPQDSTIPPWAGALLVAGGKQTEWALTTSVSVDITGPVATVAVTQVFPAATTPRDATYVLPITAGATPVDVVIKTGQRTIRAIVRERASAQKIFDAAKAQGLPAYLAKADQLFSLALGNLPANQELAARITYLDWIHTTGSECEFTMPLWCKDGWRSPVKPDWMHGLTNGSMGGPLTVHLKTGVPITEISCSHPIGKVSDSEFLTKFQSPSALPFSLRYRLTTNSPQATLASSDDPHAAYFALALYPPQKTNGQWLICTAPGQKKVAIPVPEQPNVQIVEGGSFGMNLQKRIHDTSTPESLIGHPKVFVGSSAPPVIYWQAEGQQPVLVTPAKLTSPLLPALYARAKHDALPAKTPADLAARLKLALDFGLLTPETALLAIDPANER